MVSEGERSDAPHQYRKRNARRIFYIDRRVWEHVCSLGFNEATAFLVIASGTHDGSRSSWWGAQAVAKYAGMREGPASDAIKRLIAAGVLPVLKRLGKRTLYRLAPAHEVSGTGVALPRQPRPSAKFSGLNDHESRIYDAVFRASETGRKLPVRSSSEFGSTANVRGVADMLVDRGLLERLAGNAYRAIDLEAPKAEPPPAELLWLSNDVTHFEAGSCPDPDWHDPPLKRLRRTQNALALRLFVNLHGEQVLTRFFGIEWGFPHGIRGTFKRYDVGARGAYRIWGFTPDSPSTSWVRSRLLAPYGTGDDKNFAPFWQAFELLCRLGLVEMVPHLVASEVSSNTPEPDLLHPLPIDNGEPGERAITEAAMRAAQALVAPGQWDLAIARGNAPIVPVPIDYEQVALIAIPRLRFRPQTELTARWLSSAKGEWETAAARFKELTAAAQPGARTTGGYQRGLKVGLNGA